MLSFTTDGHGWISRSAAETNRSLDTLPRITTDFHRFNKFVTGYNVQITNHLLSHPYTKGIPLGQGADGYGVYSIATNIKPLRGWFRCWLLVISNW